MLGNTIRPIHFYRNANVRGWLKEEDPEENTYEDSLEDNKEDQVEDSMSGSSSDYRDD